MRGNLTNDGTRSFEYDLENRLTSATLPAGAIGLHYDPLGRLSWTATSGGAVTVFLYDGDRLVAEYDAPGAVLRRYAHGPGVDEPLIWYEGASTSSGQNWLIADRQGSIIATTNAGGAATTYGYGPYGEPHAWTGQGGAMLSRFRYTGQAALPELQLYHYKARVYDPNLGRFLQTDPVGYEDDLNLYAYVRNDPLNQTDPTGKQSCPENTSCPDARVVQDRVAGQTRVETNLPPVRPAAPASSAGSGDSARRSDSPASQPRSAPGDSSGQVESVDAPGLPPVPDSTRDARRSSEI